MALIRSISGIRGQIAKDLTPRVIAEYVAGFSEIIPQGKVVVGRDGRNSGVWLENIVVGTLLAMGRDVIRLGIVPTPTVQVMVTELSAAGGISITASHNPIEWNGLKLINQEGVFFGQYENKKLFEIVDNYAFKCPNNFSSVITNYDAAIQTHINRILELPIFKETSLLNKIRDKKYKILIDCNNASGSFALQELLKNFGAEVIPINCEPNSLFVHPPEPNPQNLAETSKKIVEYHADIGFAVDPDADRLVIFDEKGTPVWEELTIVLAIQSVGENLEYFYPKSNKIVVNYSTTSLCEYIAKQYGLEVLRAPVGEINVVNKMKEVSAIIGGEGSGGVILPLCHYGRDSLVGISLILALVEKLNVKITELVSSFPELKMEKKTFQIYNDLEEKIENLVEFLGLSLMDVDTEDGFRISLENGWIQIRKSNTEPIVRVVCENFDKTEQERISKILDKIFNS